MLYSRSHQISTNKIACHFFNRGHILEARIARLEEGDYASKLLERELYLISWLLYLHNKTPVLWIYRLVFLNTLIMDIGMLNRL